MPIYGHQGAGPIQIREGGTGIAAIQVWHNGFLVFDGTLAGLAVGSAPGAVAMLGGDGTVRSGVTGELAVNPVTGIAGGGVRVAGSPGAIVVEGIDGSVAFGQTVFGSNEPQVINVAGGVGAATAAEPNEALGLSGAIVVYPIAGVAAGGQRAAGSTGSIVVTGIAGTVRAGSVAAGTTGEVIVAGVVGTPKAGARIAGSTGAVVVTGIAGQVNSGQTVVGTTGAVTVAGVAGTASALTYPARVASNGTAHAMRGNTNGAYTVNYPTGSASGDLVILYFHAFRNDATASTFALDGTWNTLFFEPRAWEGSAAGCYWRFRGAETSVTITPSSNIATAGHLWSIEAQMNAYVGASVDATNPIPQFSFFMDPNSGTTTPNAALFTSGPYVELLAIFSANQGSTTPFTSSWSVGTTELTDNGGSMVSPANYMSISTAYDRQLAKGNTGVNNATPSASVVARRMTLIAIAPAGTPTPDTPASISTDFGSSAGALNPAEWVTFGATPAIKVDSSGFASGVGTKSTPLARAKWFQDFPTGDYEVWAILADIGAQHSSSNLSGRISADNARGVEFAVTQTVVTISSFFDGAERWAASPTDGTGYKLRFPWGSAAPYGGGNGSTPYPEMAQALVVGARLALRCVGTTYSAYIDPPGSTQASRCWIVKDISDISSSNKRSGFTMQDDNPATSATPGMPAYAGASPPRFSSWGTIAL